MLVGVCRRRHLHLLLSVLLLFFPTCLSQLLPSMALLRFKKSLTKSDSLTNWKDDGSNPCNPNNVWVGIICSNGVVNSINLSGMDLHGQPDVGVLEVIDGIKAISLENNSLVGPMPEINRLRDLKAFYGGSNWFSGVIPPDFFHTLGSLKKLWLQHNNFSGQIPTSIGELPNLKELHLEYNEFTGAIPAFPEADIITTLDLSNNKLEGEIPDNLKKFDAEAFENNTLLCGRKLGKECNDPSELRPETESQTGSNSSAKWFIMVVVVALLILVVLAKAMHIEEDNDKPFGKGRIDEAVVNIPTAAKRSTSSSTKTYDDNTNNNSGGIGGGTGGDGGVSVSNNNITTDTATTPTPTPIPGPTAAPAPTTAPAPTAPLAPAPTTTDNSNSSSSSSKNTKENKDVPIRPSRKSGSQGPLVSGPLVGKSMGDLVMVNEERGIFGLADLMKAAAEVLGNGGLGSAYKAMMGNGVSVVVKRVREMNPLTKEVFDTEMRKLANLKHQNILTPLAYHFRKEEKLLVSEYVPRGSLLYILHGTMSSI